VHWPRGVLGAAIDMYFDDMDLGHCESLVAEHDNIPFLIHCCRDSKYVSKIMSTHGMLEMVQDHPTWRKIDGSWKSFKYTEPFSRYARAKHWVDDVNNLRHDPIGLEEVWGTKWWAMRQFTFLCSVAEVNAVQSRARGKNKVAEPKLHFRQELARQMIEKTLDDPPTPEVAPVRRQPRKNADHALKKRAAFEGEWDLDCRKFKKVTADYVRLKCRECGKGCRTYCLCYPGRPLCVGCFALHANEV
jgi:hypothetical protein